MRPVETLKESRAFRSGWEDGRFGKPGSFADNPSLAAWQEHDERLAYYRGHREGRRVRNMLRVVVAEGA
jgi:hypothetical protein